ncbi:YceI family protein [Phenylobacterium soli]|uniref:Polyisoprenoid-binding protein n=1 Tax=Phenylobacterium soli TaxID=2170551 RepID=A0A328AN87_9CAUL|nr:YceI family protein [Phenylobacterium soli]RAK56027.1 polyisoprenoid-binding protein [Phenylobacterium soli]
MSPTLARRSFALAGAAALAAVAFSAPSFAQLVREPAAVQAGTYKVEPNHTRVLFAVNHMGFSTWYGNFTHASGGLTLDPAKPEASSLSVTVPTASVETTNTVLDGELKSADWLDAAKYPTVSFKSSKVTLTGPGQADVAGELTLHGVTKPVVLHAKFNGAGVNPLDKAYTVGFEVSGKIKRSDFGVTKYVPLIGDDVDMIISAAFEKQAG